MDLNISAINGEFIAAADSVLRILMALVAYAFFDGLTWNPIIVSWVGGHTSIYQTGGMDIIMGVMNTAGASSALIPPAMSGIISDANGSLVLAFTWLQWFKA